MTAKKLEKLSEEIHKLYCKQFLKDNGNPYWTHGDYSKLDEKTKEYDRNIARFMNEHTNSTLNKIIKEIENEPECQSIFFNPKMETAIKIIKKQIK